jgi:nicotinamide-nucleotide adenylyltransferase
MRRALYIGRFQIFHVGHLDVVRHIAAAPDVDEILLAIGSPQYDHLHKSPVGPWAVNPFTLEERRAMIEQSLAGRVDKPVSLHAVTDCHPDHERWCREILALPEWHVLYTSDAGERRLFTALGQEVRDFPKRYAFHGGVVRGWIAQGEPFKDAVLPEVAEILDRIDARARLSDLFDKDRRHHAS